MKERVQSKPKQAEGRVADYQLGNCLILECTRRNSDCSFWFWSVLAAAGLGEGLGAVLGDAGLFGESGDLGETGDLDDPGDELFAASPVGDF